MNTAVHSETKELFSRRHENVRPILNVRVYVCGLCHAVRYSQQVL